MTNAALQAMVAEFGERIFCITLDNNHKIFLGLAARLPEDGVSVNDIVYKTYDGVDLFGVPHISHTWNGIDVPYTNWLVTGCIQAVHTTDELGEYLPDLNKFF